MRENLRAARKAKGMTQQAMADELGVHERYYKALESGERLGSIEIWDRLEDMFGVNQRVLREVLSQGNERK
ncbi:helix-turn-helix domain-containing protein [Oscillibacter sp. MSJ-2]|uniref:Helix-turn-helix domain-containing protein n=1 Tax=Dysosmobacter acutus TaxID=2841504 RepID=A0ABS6FBS1_9FIRM|nr:helix-turn-helix transcriptional regulator [Dysosmobacter acutus]MBU5627743.1 helix-turn-helix domain-containing protein [Dysosmobacter acutus]